MGRKGNKEGREGLNPTHEGRLDRSGLSGLSRSSEDDIPPDGRTSLMKGRRNPDMTTATELRPCWLLSQPANLDLWALGRELTQR